MIYEEEKHLLHHVLYEFTMYLYTYDMLEPYMSELINTDTRLTDINSLKFSTIIESHVLHLRNLLEFFTNKLTTYVHKGITYEGNGIRIKHIITNTKLIKSSWSGNRTIYNYLDTALNHLSKDRASYDREISIKYINDNYIKMKQNILITIERIEKGETTDSTKEALKLSIVQEQFNSLKEYLKNKGM